MTIKIEWDSYYGKGDLQKILDFEKKIGCFFPDSYKCIVSEYNGAVIDNVNLFDFCNQLSGCFDTYDSGMFLPFGDIEGTNEIMELKYEYKPDGFVKGLIIISSLGNGDSLCFDFRKVADKTEPPVVVWHHEGSPEENNEISFVAKNFDDFLNLLHD